MSEYHICKVDYNDQESLVAALEELGYKPQVHKEAQQLEGFQGDKRDQRAHVVVPRSQVGGASNDVGYERQKDGKYICHVSGYDKTNWSRKEKQIKQSYTKNRVIKYARRKGWSVRSQSKTQDGLVKVKIGIIG